MSIKLVTDVLCHCIDRGRAASQLVEPRRRAVVEQLVAQALLPDGSYDLNAIWAGLLREPGVTERALASAFAAIEDLQSLMQVPLRPTQRLQVLTPQQRQALLTECQVNRSEVEKLLRHARIEAQLAGAKAPKQSNPQMAIVPPVGSNPGAGMQMMNPAALAQMQMMPTTAPMMPTPGSGGYPQMQGMPQMQPQMGVQQGMPMMSPQMQGMGIQQALMQPGMSMQPMASQPGMMLQPGLGGPPTQPMGVQQGMMQPGMSMQPMASQPGMMQPGMSMPTPHLSGGMPVLSSGQESAWPAPDAGAPGILGNGVGGPEDAAVKDARVRAARALLEQANAEMKGDGGRPGPTMQTPDPQKARKTKPATPTVQVMDATVKKKERQKLFLALGGFGLAVALGVTAVYLSQPHDVDLSFVTAVHVSSGKIVEDGIQAVVDDPKWEKMKPEARKAAAADAFNQVKANKKIHVLILRDSKGNLLAEVNENGPDATPGSPTVLVSSSDKTEPSIGPPPGSTPAAGGGGGARMGGPPAPPTGGGNTPPPGSAPVPGGPPPGAPPGGPR